MRVYSANGKCVVCGKTCCNRNVTDGDIDGDTPAIIIAHPECYEKFLREESKPQAFWDSPTIDYE